jgi:hypothetical protein
METLLEWIRSNPALSSWLVAGSVITFVGTLIIVPILVVRIPADYFMPDRVSRGAFVDAHPILRIVALVLKNLCGAIFFVAGVAMLALPGQGLLMMLLGVLLLNFPGKQNLEIKLVRLPHVLNTLNRIRHRYTKPPLELPEILESDG